MGWRPGATCVLAAGLVAATAVAASATPSTGVSGVVVARYTIGGTDYILREITIAPGGSTGWHFHDGPLYAVVRNGWLAHYDSACVPDGEHPTGNAFIEAPGRDHVHIGRNEGVEPLVLDVLYVLPAGSPLARDAADPGCRLR
ncbi:cupin [Nocardia sp. CDC159]|uniref:Cupin n=1 Tax=Nocardia pulmonis TaxID=2951408 RepID=A0A9X2E1B2_9NOCA|nr:MULTISPECIES: cupin [Nocardia]MCM6772024.1 cupin [Nocardia pulmonis]MCM6785318.1 cupin [Nocardia sp. CDC159]